MWTLTKVGLTSMLYNHDDYGMSEEQLALKYNVHPVYDLADYQRSESQAPYWAWVKDCLGYEEFAWGEAVARGELV